MKINVNTWSSTTRGNTSFQPDFFLNQKKLDEIEECRLLGVTLTNNMSFERNTEKIVKNAYSRMIMIRKLSEFCVPMEDMLNIYVLYICSAAEQSCVVWHSSLTEEGHTELERIQKVALRIILQDLYESYENALKITNLQTL